MSDYLVIATWRFGMTAVKAAAALLAQNRPALDAAVAGAQAVEDDPSVHSVGFAGTANALGTVQLDACVMDGQTLSCGAVAAVENVRHVAALARRVMEKTPHILLVGDGARQFAQQEGFRLETLHTPESVAEWEKLMRARKAAAPAGGAAPPSAPSQENHDTVTVLVRDQQGRLGGVCTTSGLALKLHGRVGDSPLIGHGLYVDSQAGAAGATGVGEEIIRIGGSLHIVETMRGGKSAQEACESAVRRVIRTAARRGVHPASVAFLAIDTHGRHGAACTEAAKFEYAVARPGNVELLTAKVVAAGPT